MIKNRMIDDIDSFKRRIIHDDTLQSIKNIPNRKTKMEQDIAGRKVRFNTEESEPVSCDLDGELEKIGECLGNITCDDMTKTDKDMPELASQENKMKELYDFVFLEDSNSNSKGLNEFFPEDVKDVNMFDKTEVDVHNAIVENKFEENKNGHCNFEVIGVIESENDSDVYGLDSLSSKYSFKI